MSTKAQHMDNACRFQSYSSPDVHRDGSYKSRCKLIGNHLEIPHDTIPSTVVPNTKKKENS